MADNSLKQVPSVLCLKACACFPEHGNIVIFGFYILVW